MVSFPLRIISLLRHQMPDAEDAEFDAFRTQYEKNRLVPLTLSPFESEGGQKHDVTESDRLAEWFELSGDLAWTASFSSLTSNTHITSWSGIFSYTVLFLLIWPLWATQTMYDLKYRTNDWWHRVFLLLQLSVYASLASFSEPFDVSWMIGLGNHSLLVQAIDAPSSAASAAGMVAAFKGVNLILMTSRLLLLLQYLRVLYYRRRTYRTWSCQDLVHPSLLFVAAIAFLSSFLLVDTARPQRSTAIGQYILWAIAISAQMAAWAYDLGDSIGSLEPRGTIGVRLRALTAIILGEGLNGICSTLHQSFDSLSLTPQIIANAIGLLFISFFLWLLYFDGHQLRVRQGARAQAFDYLVFHLALILLLESLKNAFLLIAMKQAVFSFTSAFDGYVAGDTSGLPSLQRVGFHLGQSWDDVEQSWQSTGNETQLGNVSYVDPVKRYTWYIDCITSIVGMYQEPDNRISIPYKEYISNTTQLIEDMNNADHPLFGELLQFYYAAMMLPASWVLPVAGVTLMLLGKLIVSPRGRTGPYIHIYQLIRYISGGGLLTVGVTYMTLGPYVPLPWLIGIVSVVLGVATALDRIVLYFSVRAIKRAEESPKDEWYGDSEAESSTCGRTDYPGPLTTSRFIGPSHPSSQSFTSLELHERRSRGINLPARSRTT